LKYNCSPAEIREWNHLQSDFIAPGQELVIWTSELPREEKDKSIF